MSLYNCCTVKRIRKELIAPLFQLCIVNFESTTVELAVEN